MSKSNKKDVGKGIRALLSNIEKQETGSKKDLNVKPTLDNGPKNKLALKLIVPNPFQPRTNFDDNDLEELVQSIKIHGIIQPIAVRKLNNKSYQIISGERRWRAAKRLKLTEVPVHILEADDQAMLEMALLENIQRADLNPIEISLTYKRLLDECKLTHEELSERVGKKRSSITNHLRLLKLSPAVQEALKEKTISLGHAKVIAGIDLIENQTLILGKILQGGLSVRSTEAAVKALSSTTRSTSKKKNEELPIIVQLRRKLSERLGTKVQISRDDSGKGAIRIPFGNDDEFNDIIDTIIDS